MKINSKIDLKIMLDNYYKQTNDILIFRNIFSPCQRKMFIIMYNDKSKRFRLIVYNVFTGHHFNKLYSNKYIRGFFPYLEQMIAQKKFPEIGERIFKVFKNQMLMYQHLEENKQQQKDRPKILVKMHNSESSISLSGVSDK